MAETYKQALQSTDAEFIKQVRAQFKGKVTRHATTLRTILKQTDKEGSPFDHENIDSEEVASVVSDLNQAKQAIEELHVRYGVTRKHEESEAEELLEEKDNEYISGVELTFREVMKKYNSYVVEHKARQELQVSQDKLATEVRQFPEKLKLFKQQRQEFDTVYKDAVITADSEDTSVQRTTEHHKTHLEKEFDKLQSLGTDLLSLVPQVDSTVLESGDQELLDCSKEKINFRQVLAKLERVIKQLEISDM